MLDCGVAVLLLAVVAVVMQAAVFHSPQMLQVMVLTDDAKRMRERIQALEAILDAEHPNWRDK